MEGANVGKQKRAIESPSGWGTRHTIVVVAALGNLLGYFLRVDMSVAIVAMVDQSEEVTIFAPLPESFPSCFYLNVQRSVKVFILGCSTRLLA